MSKKKLPQAPVADAVGQLAVMFAVDGSRMKGLTCESSTTNTSMATLPAMCSKFCI